MGRQKLSMDVKPAVPHALMPDYLDTSISVSAARSIDRLTNETWAPGSEPCCTVPQGHTDAAARGGSGRQASYVMHMMTSKPRLAPSIWPCRDGCAVRVCASATAPLQVPQHHCNVPSAARPATQVMLQRVSKVVYIALTVKLQPNTAHRWKNTAKATGTDQGSCYSHTCLSAICSPAHASPRPGCLDPA